MPEETKTDGQTVFASQTQFTAEPLYLGHPGGYWADYFIGNGPFMLFIMVCVVIVTTQMKWQRKLQGENKKFNDSARDTQLKAYQEMQTTNKLLAEISQKLDKK